MIGKFWPEFIKNISVSRFILALIMAVAIWGYVTATQFPEKTLSLVLDLDTPVPTSADLVQVPQSGQVTAVRAIFSGPADEISTIVPTQQVRPYLDLSTLKTPGPHDVKVSYRADLLPPDVTVKFEPASVQVVLEPITSKEIKVDVITTGDVNPDYYLENPPDVTPQQITIRGRASLVDQVAKTQVLVNLSGRVGPLQALLPVQLIDNKGQTISLNDANNNGLTVNPSQVNVSANISYKLSTRTVPIRVITKGDPAPGYIAGTAQTNPTLATVTSGNAELLSQLNYIDTLPIDLNGATSELSGTVQLDQPKGATVVQGSAVQYRIGIVPFQTTNRVAVPIQFINQAANYRYRYSTTTVDLLLSGPYQAFQPTLPLDKIKATVDLADRAPDTYVLPVQVELPPNLVITNSPTVTVTVTRAPQPTPVPPTLTPVPSPTSAPPTTTAPVQPPGTSPAATPAAPAPRLSTPGPATVGSISGSAPELTQAPAPTPTPVPSTPAAIIPPGRGELPGYTPSPASEPAPPIPPRFPTTPRLTVGPVLTPGAANSLARNYTFL